MGRIWNEKRLKNYPRLMFIGVWLVMLLNLILHHGWSGGFGIVIGVDFISQYASGLQYRSDIQNLYSLQSQYNFQQQIYQQEEYLGKYSIFPSPPYVALINSFISLIPFGYAFAIWTVISIIAGLVSIFLIARYLIPETLKQYLPFSQLFFIVFGFFPVVYGLMTGQNHLLTLLILTSILVLSLKKRWLLSGIILGLLIYKPHLVIGFLIIALLRGRIKVLLGFSLVTLVLVGAVVLQHGLAPYLSYYKFMGETVHILIGLMFETTVLAFLYSVLRGWLGNFVGNILPYWTAVFCILLGIVIATPRVRESQIVEYIFAILLPFIISPHLLVYDIIPLILVFILWAKANPSLKLSYLSVHIYLGILIIALISSFIGISLLGLIPIILCYLLSRDLILPKKVLQMRSIQI